MALRTLFFVAHVLLVFTWGQQAFCGVSGDFDQNYLLTQSYRHAPQFLEKRVDSEALDLDRESLETSKEMNRITMEINRATQDMRNIALFGLIINAVGGFILIGTLLLMHKANQSSMLSVDATRSIGEAQVRAYVVCKGANYETTKDGLVLTLLLANVGNSPATNIKLKSTVSINVVGGLSNMPRVLESANSKDCLHHCQMIAASSEIEENEYYFWDLSFPGNEWQSDDEAIRVAKSGNDLVIDVRIEWTDVFGKTQEIVMMLNSDINKKDKKGSMHISLDGQHDSNC